MAYGGNFRLEPTRAGLHPGRRRARLFDLRMTPLDVVDGEQAAVPYDPARHGALLQALRTGQTATVAVYDPSSNPRPYLLGGRPGVVDAAMARCGAPALTAGLSAPASPATDPARFVQVDPALAHPEATALARTPAGRDIGGGATRGTDVTASIADPAPTGGGSFCGGTRCQHRQLRHHGRRNLRLHGRAGRGRYRQAYATTGVSLWLDTAQLSEGFPDIWVQSYRRGVTALRGLAPYRRGPIPAPGESARAPERRIAR